MKPKNKKIYLMLIILLALAASPLVSSAADSYKPYLHNPVVPKNPGASVQGSFETVLSFGRPLHLAGIST